MIVIVHGDFTILNDCNFKVVAMAIHLHGIALFSFQPSVGIACHQRHACVRCNGCLMDEFHAVIDELTRPRTVTQRIHPIVGLINPASREPGSFIHHMEFMHRYSGGFVPLLKGVKAAVTWLRNRLMIGS